MNAETILRSDLLDIIFENRNKQYGAYPLRKEYNKRLYHSIGLIAGFVLVLSGWYYFQKQTKPADNKNFNGLLVGDTIKLKKLEMPPVEQPPLQKKLPPVATITNDPPRIVPDNQVTDTTTHTVEDLNDKVISDVTAEGPAATGDNQTAEKHETGTTAAPSAEPAPEPTVVETAEIMPEFPGGIPALIRFLGKNLQVPEDAMEPGQRVRVPVKFVVNKDGELSDVAFLTQTGDAFKKEILRVMSKMPKWKPGSQHRKTVAVYYTIPVIFDMGEN